VTEHDSVYAIDATTGKQYWHTSFINNSNVTTVPEGNFHCQNNDIVGTEYGITSTPVIDASAGILYVVPETLESGTYVYRLHALDITTGFDKAGSPLEITGAANGDTFQAFYQMNRPGLLLENGHVIIAWGSHCDNPTYYGWVMSYTYKNSTLQQEAVYNADQSGLQLNGGLGAGIWMSGGGVASDSAGNLYFATGNGDFTSPNDFGCSILKLSPPSGGTFAVADYFTPYNVVSLCKGSNDIDVGSGGVLLLPDQTGDTHDQLLVQMGKHGTLYLVDRTNLGKYCNGCSSDTNIVQEIDNATVGVWGSPAYWNGSVYFGGAHTGGPSGPVKAFSLYSSIPQLDFTSETPEVFSFPTPTPSVSAPSSNSGGIVWVLDNAKDTSSSGPTVLHAYNATNLANELATVNAPYQPVKFSVPTIANGKVYVGTGSALLAFGLNTPASASLTPTSLTFDAGGRCTSPPQTVTVKNTSSLFVSLGGWSVSSYFNLDSTYTTCSQSLNPGQSCSIGVTFTNPSCTGSNYSGTLKVVDAANNSPQTATLTGVSKGNPCFCP